MTKPSIYYFSATGNSLYAAKQIAGEISGEIIRVTDTTPKTCNSTVIGFVYPIYYWGIPNLMEKFIKELEITSEKTYIFSIATCGSSSGNAAGQIDALLAPKGHYLGYETSIPMVSNYIRLYDIDKSGMNEKLKKADSQIIAAAQAIKKKSIIKIKKWPLFSKAVYKYYDNTHAHSDKNFWTNKACTGCGICSKICPVGNITVENKIPTFNHRCQNCFACIHWCPYKALQYGSKTENRGRYHHPEVSLKELSID